MAELNKNEPFAACVKAFTGGQIYTKGFCWSVTMEKYGTVGQ